MTEPQSAATFVLDQPLVRAAETALAEAFECSFHLWAPADPWRQVSSPDAPAAADPSPRVVEFLEGSMQPGAGPVLLEQAADHHFLVLPIRRNGKARLVATATFQTSTPELLMKLGRLFLREFDQRERLRRQRGEKEAYIAEITHSFEELVFLRHMGEYLELADLTQDPRKLAETVLPVLCKAIKAESLVLAPAQEEGLTCDAANAAVGHPTLWIGPHSTDGETCRRLVEQYRSQADQQPVVKNSFHEMPEGARFSGVRSFLLVPTAAAGHTTGWLLAVNRIPTPGVEPRDGRCLVSESQFGTVEAGLVSSAASILAIHARNVELFKQKERILLGAIRSLVSAIDAKDPYTSGHSERVALFAMRVGQELGLEREACYQLYLGGLLHDVGKIAISGTILRKVERLTDGEFNEIKQHPERAWKMLQELEDLRDILPAILHHHEEFDGSGYPDALAGEQIPLDARILAVADAYDAMTSDRPYREGMPQEKVEAILRKGAGAQWDPRVVEAFFAAMPNLISFRQSYRPRPQPRRKLDSTAEPSEDATRIDSETQTAAELQFRYLTQYGGLLN